MSISFYAEKIIPPVIQSQVTRQTILDLVSGQKARVVWICSPAGTGKTALALQLAQTDGRPYLWYNIDRFDKDPAVFFNILKQAVGSVGANFKELPDVSPDDLLDLKSFAIFFFSRLTQCMSSGFVLILDDYQRLDPDAPLHNLLVHALMSCCSMNMRIIVNSRESMPSTWMRMIANSDLITLTWNDLRISIQEVEAFLSHDDRFNKSPKIHKLAKSLHRLSDGWVSGLKLLLATLDKANDINDLPSFHDGQKALYRYFSFCVLSELDDETYSVLLKSSILPFIPINLFNDFCQSQKARHIIESLYLRHFFISRLATNTSSNNNDTIYIFHDLLRDYLSDQSVSLYTTEQLSDIYLRAGMLFNQFGWIEEGLSLLMNAHAWDICLDQIESLAPLLLKNGRNTTLLNLIEQLPQNLRYSRINIEYWHGLCLMPHRLTEAQQHHEAAFQRYRACGNTQYMISSWSAMVDCIWLQWGDCKQLDPWLDELTVLCDHVLSDDTEHQQLLTKGAFTAMSLRRMDHPDLPYWEEKNLNMLEKGLPLNEMIMRALQMMIHYTWGTGQRVKSHLVLSYLHTIMDEKRCSETVQCLYHVMASVHDYWFSLTTYSCLNHVNLGLEKASKFGLPFWNIIMINVALFKLCNLGNIEASKCYLDKISTCLNEHSGANDVSVYYHFNGYISWLEGDSEMALGSLHKALSLALSTGFSFSPLYYQLAIARILADMGRLHDAMTLVSKSRKQAIAYRSCNILYMAHLVTADIVYQTGHLSRAMRYARHAFRIGREQRYYAQPWVKRDSYLVLAKAILNADRDDRYAAQCISLFSNEIPPCDIFILGRCEITKPYELKPTSYKLSSTQIRLLKRLIIQGENNSISCDELIDSIWPEIDFDKAYARLKTTVRRLRKMLGNKDSILFKDGQIKLNNDLCRIDSWRFVMLTNSLPSINKELIIQLFELYQGAFCDRGYENCDLLLYKSSLEARFESVVNKVTNHYSQLNDWQTVLDIYQQALNRDHLNEHFFKGIVSAMVKLDRKHEIKELTEDFRQYVKSKTGEEPTLDAVH
jgi:ATP/maltotriose-dependent transcriptional regulator MalT/DNA-binding SARP family transcriptional activator